MPKANSTGRDGTMAPGGGTKCAGMVVTKGFLGGAGPPVVSLKKSFFVVIGLGIWILGDF